MNLSDAFLKIPEMLNKDFSIDESFSYVVNTFEEYLGFDFVLIGYLNSEGIEVKAMSEPNKYICFSGNNCPEKLFNNFINNKKAIKFLTSENLILDEIGISIKKKASAAIFPLNIKGAIFGIIIGINFSKEPVSEDVFIAAQGFAGTCSYIIKDAELSNVFKMQLKILNDNVIEKTGSLKDIKEQSEKIKEAEKIKTEFLMNMSHSLRTPLNAIISLSEAFEMNAFGKLTSKQKEHIIDIQNSGKEMLSIINDILDMSKIEAGAMRIVKEKTNVCLLIKEAVVIIKSLADKKKIKIKTKIPKKSLYIFIDGQKINQVLYNLLSNAVKFTNENGNIEIGIKELKHAVQIYIKDDGIGIDKKYHGKIFGKFEQIDNSYSGKYASTGLGLTITKELIELHGGKIWLESKINEGTTFIFELPKK